MKIITAIGRLTRSTTQFSHKPALLAALAVVTAVSLWSISSASQMLDIAGLRVARVGHTGTQLADGRVLIVGGQNAGGPVMESEIFDPASRIFSPGAKARDGRAEHTATLLSDGRVLVTGGRAHDGSLDSTEIYDPAKSSFSYGPRLNHARAGHTATVLADGRLLIAGGDEEGTAEIFDPETQKFDLLEARLGAPRNYHAAVLLQNGKVLLAGGLGESGGGKVSAELFDPEALQFFPTANQMHIERFRPTLNLLPDGKLQVIGGDHERTMEMFNPDGEYFTAYAHLLNGPSLGALLRSESRAALLHRTDSEDPQAVRALEGPAGDLLDRSGYSLVNITGSNITLAAGGVSSGGVVQSTAVLFPSSGATVTTDKTDYQPGQTAIITGSGWKPGETVSLVLHREPTTAADTGLSSVADRNGNFTNNNYVVAQYDLGVTFTLTATGQTSGYTAQTTFTDNVVITSVSLAGGTPWTAFSNPGGIHVSTNGQGVSTAVGASISVSVTATLSASDHAWHGTSWLFATSDPTDFRPISQGGPFRCVNTNDDNTVGTFTETITTTAPSTPLGYSLYVIAAKDNNCTQSISDGTDTLSASDVYKLSGGVTVGKTTTTVASSVNPSVFGQAVTFTATVNADAGGTASGGTVQFQVDGANFGAPVTLSGGAATSSSTSTLSTGTHPVTAIYSGSGSSSFQPSTGTLAGGQVVNPRTTQTVVTRTVGANPSTYGDSVTFTATVTGTGPGSGNPGAGEGSVTFKADGTAVCGAVALNASGQAACSTSALKVPGSPHTITAEYSGATNFLASSGTLTGGQTVQPRTLTPHITAQTRNTTAPRRRR